MSEDRELRIRARAYARWEEEGRPEGRAMEHWLAAERDVPDGDETPTIRTQGIGTRPPEDDIGPGRGAD